MTIVEMQMNIDCDGCEDNVRKALLRLQGVDYVDMDRTRGKVTVTGSTSQKKQQYSSYNYRVHGYFDSDLHGYSHHLHDHADVVPIAARNYFSDENPHACAIM
ncbi:hypothetical protein GUJ93_ZPchr0006g46006 [Zizania palustris]|uniref:HMA domain-containing protein n=1 Tax=Zizania palustris TaxID=103762 RepID=A0A8J5SGF4_ZIZPA|nr:hypothetical protein GUJ93_ZPchr0006g46006 [Zizania palustris]